MSNLRNQALSIFREAINAEIGIKVRVEIPAGFDIAQPTMRAKQILYRFRKELQDPLFNQLQIRLDPDDPDVFIWVLKTNEAEPESETETEPETKPNPTLPDLDNL